MSIDETIEALRNCAYNNSCNGCPFALVVDDEDCKNNMMIAVADQLEQLNDFEQSQCAILLRKIARLEVERNELKANQPVRCGECKHLLTSTNKDMEIKYGCNYLGLAPMELNDFCSYGERRGVE